MNGNAVVLVVIAVAAVYLIGTGITGLVVNDGSCCFPPDCPEKDICDSAKEPIQESPGSVQVQNFAITAFGIFLLIVFIGLTWRHLRR